MSNKNPEFIKENKKQPVRYYLGTDKRKYPIFVRISEQDIWLFKPKAKRERLVKYYEEFMDKYPNVRITSLLQLELIEKGCIWKSV